ncbi:MULTISPECIES: hypothetical protein [Vibrio]|uniref:hypothetical protein n=1 Tax=Vibrio TaxID=662 RepID=UPI00097EB1A9|nr:MULTISPECIES: hypothetical protein [Vibrio]SJN27247.1 hypothetical protein FM109_07435 [Vibrio casei]
MKKKDIAIMAQSAQERFKHAYLNSRQGIKKLELDLNRSHIIVVTDNGRRIYRPYGWDH